MAALTDIASPPVGSLTDRVALQRKVATGEDEGGTAITFVPIATVWARVRPVAQRLGQSADGRAVTLTHTAVMRFRTDVVPGDRLVFRGRNLEIVGAEDLNGHRAYLSCTCTETGQVG
jgi:SPP1 family predicted phage head-tail adaptor